MRVATKRAHYYKETALKPTVLAVQSEAEHKVIQVTSPKLLSGHVLCGVANKQGMYVRVAV